MCALVTGVLTCALPIFWAAAMMPMNARASSAPQPPAKQGKLPRWAISAPLVLVAVLGPVLLPTRFVPSIPLDAIARLKQEHVRGTVYGDFPFGGALIDGGCPAWRVAYDGRYYRYSSDEWKYNGGIERSEEHTSELQSLMRNS